MYILQTYALYTQNVVVKFSNWSNFDPSLLTNKLWLIFIGMKQKKIFLFKNKFQNGRLKKNWVFQNCQFSKCFRENFMDWSLALMWPYGREAVWCKLKNSVKTQVFKITSDSLTTMYKNKCKEISFCSNSPELQGNGRLLSGLKVPALILRSEF